VKYFTLILLYLVVACSNSTAPEQISSFRVMSYNVRVDTPKDTGSHDWDERKENVAEVIRQADLIGVQEPSLGQYEDLQGFLEEYESFGKGETFINAIFFRPGKFRVLDADTIHLPKLDGSSIPRTIHWAHFNEIETNETLLMFNIHLDHLGALARVRGVETLRDSSKSYSNRFQTDRILVTGDFNSVAGTPQYNILVEDGFNDSMLAIEYDREQNTFSGWGLSHLWEEWDSIFGKPNYFIRIDYIFVKVFEVLEFELIQSAASDHFPIIATLR